MLSLARLFLIAIALLLATQAVYAGDALVDNAPSANAGAAAADVLPVLLGQASTDSSSGGSFRIPRGLIRLAIFGVIALFGAGAWVVRKLS